MPPWWAIAPPTEEDPNTNPNTNLNTDLVPSLNPACHSTIHNVDRNPQEDTLHDVEILVENVEQLLQANGLGSGFG